RRGGGQPRPRRRLRRCRQAPARGLPGAPGDRPAFRRPRDARRADAWQDLAGGSRRHRAVRRPPLAVHSDALSFADRRGHSRVPGGQRDERNARARRHRRDGLSPPRAADPRRAVPPREHSHRARARPAGEFPSDLRDRSEGAGVSVLPPVDRPLEEDEAEAAFGAMLDGVPSDEEIAAFLVALSDRGETAAEIAGAARAMRARLIPVSAPANAIDVCGTGGDGHHTLNVSTAVALVVAACGVPVAKHGNRAASSKAGAADTLEALGLDLDRAMETAEQTLADLGIGFLFAGKHHPAMGRIMPIRRAIGRRTIFNLMGPLANPAGVRRQLVGIARPAYVPIYAEALA